MEYLLFPLVVVTACFALGCFALTHNSWPIRLRVCIASIAFLISYAVVGLSVYIYKEVDDNSYYAASVHTLLDEITTALRANEPGFLERLERFESEQTLTYENRGDLLENARRFREEGQGQRAG